MGAFGHRKLDPDGIAFHVVIFDFGFRQRRTLHHAPHDGLGATVQLAGHGEFHQFPGNGRLGIIGHGGIGIVPVPGDAEPLELPALHVQPVLGKGAAFLAELVDGHLVLVPALCAVLLLDLPFDGQAVAVPARHINGIISQHLHGSGDQILEYLVQGVADVNIAVGVRGTIMQDIFFPPFGQFAQPHEHAHVFPLFQPAGLAFGQSGPHGKVGFWQKQGTGVIACPGVGIGIGHVKTCRKSLVMS